MAPSFDEIQQAAGQQLKVLQSREGQLAAEIRAMRNKPNKSAGEARNLDRLREEQELVVAAIGRISALTAAGLDNTDEMSRIADELTKIPGDLRAKGDLLKSIGTGAKTVGDVLTEIDSLVTKVDELISNKNKG